MTIRWSGAVKFNYINEINDMDGNCFEWFLRQFLFYLLRYTIKEEQKKSSKQDLQNYHNNISSFLTIDSGLARW